MCKPTSTAYRGCNHTVMGIQHCLISADMRTCYTTDQKPPPIIAKKSPQLCPSCEGKKGKTKKDEKEKAWLEEDKKDKQDGEERLLDRVVEKVWRAFW